MGTDLSHGRPRSCGQIGTIRWIGLFVVAWALFAVTGSVPQSTESPNSYEVAPAAQAVIAAHSSASRPPLVPVGATPLALVAGAVARPSGSKHTPAAERRDPPPSLFHRVSYRTTAPPSKNG